MKKTTLIIFVLSLNLFSCSPDRTEFIGTFESDPRKIFEFKKPLSEKQKELLERLSWKLTVTENEFILYTGEKGPLKMTYFVQGKCIVGEDADSDEEFYFPLYFKDRNSVYGGGQTLKRVGE